MKLMMAVLTAAVVGIAAILVYTTFIRDTERNDARDYFERYLKTCDEEAPDNATLEERLDAIPEYECYLTVDKLMEQWEDAARPEPSKIAAD